MIRADDRSAPGECDCKTDPAVLNDRGRVTIAQAIVDVLRILHDVRRERDVYRDIAVCAIHRLHDQYVQITGQRVRISRLCGELYEHRNGGTPPNTRRPSRSDLHGL